VDSPNNLTDCQFAMDDEDDDEMMATALSLIVIYIFPERGPPVV